MKRNLAEPIRWHGVWTRALIAAALISLGLCWPRLLAGREQAVEACFSGAIYPVVARVLSAITSLVPFSIAELLLYALMLGLPALLITRAVQVALRRFHWRRLLRLIASLALAAGVLLNLFYATWGFNYFRVPLAERMGLDVRARSAEELEAFVLETAAEARALREALPENEDGVFRPTESRRAIFDALPGAYAKLAERFPLFSGHVTRAKDVLWSKELSWQGISGIYIGLTAEPNVNVDQPPLLIYEAAAHEMAHGLGVAPEDEAEFAAYLACLGAEDPSVRYSGLAFALIMSGNALYKADAERYRAAAATYGDAVWRDLSAYDGYWDSFEGEARESADKRNDAYLKHNSQPSGVASYGESVDLMLAYRERYDG